MSNDEGKTIRFNSEGNGIPVKDMTLRDRDIKIKVDLRKKTEQKGVPVRPVSATVSRSPLEIKSPLPVPLVKQPEEQHVKSPVPLSDKEVTDHTATMWKYQIAKVGPDPAPEYLNGIMSFPGGRFISARVRGKKHKHEGTYCDDWYEVGQYGNIIFAAVADGAGSKKFSRVGAKESCETAIGYLTTSFERLLTSKPELVQLPLIEAGDPRFAEIYGFFVTTVQEAVKKAHEGIEIAFLRRVGRRPYSEALGRTLSVKDLSATLLVMAAIPIGDRGKDRLVITCQIGDGMIALLNTNGNILNSLKLMGDPDSGEYSGETEFLTSLSSDMLQRKTKVTTTDANIIFMMTDGVADDYFPNKTELYRLYFDLVLNGVLEYPLKSQSESNGNFPPLRKLAPTLSREQISQLSAEDQRKVMEWKLEDVKTLNQNKDLKGKIPAPIAYPWVNNPKIMVPVQYTERICEALGLPLKDIWKNPDIFEAALNTLDNKVINPSERLRIWLDNYTRRTSADDRTLVIAQM